MIPCVSFRLPGGCNLFLNNFNRADGSFINEGAHSVLHSPRSAARLLGVPVSMQVLTTWRSPRTAIVYPSAVVVSVGAYASWLLTPHFADAEFDEYLKDASGELLRHADGSKRVNLADTLWEGGVALQLIKASPQFHRDCPAEAEAEAGAGATRDSGAEQPQSSSASVGPDANGSSSAGQGDGAGTGQSNAARGRSRSDRGDPAVNHGFAEYVAYGRHTTPPVGLLDQLQPYQGP